MRDRAEPNRVEPDRVEPNRIEPKVFTVSQFGAHAARVLSKPCTGEIAAVFENSFYLSFGEDFICLGTENLGRGPLNVSVSQLRPADWTGGKWHVGDRVEIIPGGLCITDDLVIDVAQAETWIPRDIDACWCARDLARGLDALDGLMRDHVPLDGLGYLMDRASRDAIDTPLARFVAQPVAMLDAWLEDGLNGDLTGVPGELDDICALVGAGPGLTPSGDDYLGGVMIALHQLGASHVLDPLNDAVSNRLGDTTPISAAHLRCAMAGMGGCNLHLVLSALVSGDETALEPSFRALAGLGHTSGWDMLSGLVAVLRTCRDSDIKMHKRQNICKN